MLIGVYSPGERYAEQFLGNYANLYLLDANVQENGPTEREITYQLYGGDSEMRLKQEMLPVKWVSPLF